MDLYQEFCCSVAQSCLTLCNAMNCSTPRIRGSLPVVFLLGLSYSMYAEDHFSGLKDGIYLVLFPPHCFSSLQRGSSLKAKPGRSNSDKEMNIFGFNLKNCQSRNGTRNDCPQLTSNFTFYHLPDCLWSCGRPPSLLKK